MRTSRVTPRDPEVINRQNLKSVLASQGNEMFRATFNKRNGQERSMVARLGVKNHLKGGKNTVESSNRPYITVFDMHTKAYRSINLETVSEVKICGNVFEIK